MEEDDDRFCEDVSKMCETCEKWQGNRFHYEEETPAVWVCPVVGLNWTWGSKIGRGRGKVVLSFVKSSTDFWREAVGVLEDYETVNFLMSSSIYILSNNPEKLLTIGNEQSC